MTSANFAAHSSRDFETGSKLSVLGERATEAEAGSIGAGVGLETDSALEERQDGLETGDWERGERAMGDSSGARP
jgi:hypothetical protein